MKRYNTIEHVYFHLASMLLTQSSCQHTKLGMLSDQSLEVVMAQQTNKAEETEEVPRPIAQAAAKQLIMDIPPNEPFCVWVTQEQFSHLGLDFKDFFYVIYLNHNKALLCYQEEMAPDLLPIVQDYYTQHPMSLQTIPVKDAADYDLLLSKTTGFKMSPRQYNTNCVSIGNTFHLARLILETDATIKSCYHVLDLDNLHQAYNIVRGQKTKAECAVVVAIRAIVFAKAITTMSRKQYESLIKDYKELLNEQISRLQQVTVCGGLATSALGLGLTCIPILGPIATKMFISGVVTTAGVATFRATSDAYSKMTRFVVSPWHLSRYINKHLSNSAYAYSEVHHYNDFTECSATIKEDMVDKDQVIALFFYEAKHWHYINVVGIKKDPRGRVMEFIVLDTNKMYYAIASEDMKSLMFNEHKMTTTSLLWPRSNHYIIRFVPKSTCRQ